MSPVSVHFVITETELGTHLRLQGLKLQSTYLLLSTVFIKTKKETSWKRALFPSPFFPFFLNNKQYY